MTTNTAELVAKRFWTAIDEAVEANDNRRLDHAAWLLTKFPTSARAIAQAELDRAAKMIALSLTA